MKDEFKYGKAVSYTYNFLTNNFGHKTYYDEFFSQIDLPLKDNDLVLDVGCGSGLLAFSLLREYKIKRGINIIVHGFDISRDILQIAYRKSLKIDFQDNIKLFLGNAQDISKLEDFTTAKKIKIKDNSYSVVMCSGVLEYIIDIKKATSELQRVLNPNGTLIISSVKNSLLGKISSRLWKFRIVSSREISDNLDNIELKKFTVDSSTIYMKFLKNIYMGTKRSEVL